MRAARRDALGLFGVAHERRDGVTAAKQCFEHGTANVTGRTRKKNAHGLRSLLCRRGFHHNSDVPRDTLIDFFDDLAPSTRRISTMTTISNATVHLRSGWSAARAFSARLAALGLAQGDKVVFWCENRPEWIVAFWGCLIGGVIVVPVDYRASPEFLARVTRIVAAGLIVVGQDVPLLADAPIPVWKLHEMDWSAGAPDTSVDHTKPRIGRDDVAEIIFTSGATADPKGVVITHRNVLANIVPVEREVVKYRKWGRPFFPIRFLNLLPLSHMFGQAMATFIPPMLPGTVIFMRGYNPADIVAEIKSRRVSVLVSVPKILDVLREHVLRVAPEAAGVAPKEHVARRWWRYRRIHRLFGLKFWSFVVGAAPLETELEAFWGQLGFVVIQGYGLTETAPIVTLNHPFGTKKGSVGKAIAGVEMKIAGDGEILVRGENVTTGYFNAAAETARAFEDGWFHTGDVGEIGPDGQLFIRGRKKEMIVTPEGLNVFPEDVERVLNHLPGVRDSAVVGTSRPAGRNGFMPQLVLEPGVDPDESGAARRIFSWRITRRFAAGVVGRSASCRVPTAMQAKRALSGADADGHAAGRHRRRRRTS